MKSDKSERMLFLVRYVQNTVTVLVLIVDVLHRVLWIYAWNTNVGNIAVYKQKVWLFSLFLFTQFLFDSLLDQCLHLAVLESFECQKSRWEGGYLLFWRSGRWDFWCLSTITMILSGSLSWKLLTRATLSSNEYLSL